MSAADPRTGRVARGLQTGVLCDSQIRRLVQDPGAAGLHKPLITEFSSSGLKGASYDLRLGSEYFTLGEHGWLDEKKRSIALKPGQFILLTSFEHLWIPTNMVARAGLRGSSAQKGLVSFFSPQIDPGFAGLIIVPLFNSGNATAILELHDRMFTVEFIGLGGVATVDWLADREPLTGIKAGSVKGMAGQDLSQWSTQIERLESTVSKVSNKLDVVEGFQSGYRTGVAEKIANSARIAGWIAIVVAAIIWIADRGSADGSPSPAVTVNNVAPTQPSSAGGSRAPQRTPRAVGTTP